MTATTPPPPSQPDGKDWTWAIERACPDCGFDPATVSPAGYPEAIRLLAARFPAALAGPAATRRPAPEVWSPVEYARHVADVCLVMADRLSQILAAEDVAEFASWDGEAAAVADRYWEATPEAAAALLADRVDDAAVRFALPTGSQWELRGLRGDGMAFTAATLGLYLLHELAHHAHDVGA